jgi:hypothetical protein
MKENRDGGRRKLRDIIRLSHAKRGERLAPPRKPDAPSGVIQFQTGKLPTEFASFREKRESNRPGAVLIVIVTLALVFIALIAWFIAHEPPG